MSVFTPTEDSQAVTVTTTSQAIALSGSKRARKALSIVNMNYTKIVYARFGDSSVTVSASNGYVVSAPIVITNTLLNVIGKEKIIGIPHGVTHVAFITTGAGSSVDIQVTEGDLLSD